MSNTKKILLVIICVIILIIPSIYPLIIDEINKKIPELSQKEVGNLIFKEMEKQSSSIATSNNWKDVKLSAEFTHYEYVKPTITEGGRIDASINAYISSSSFDKLDQEIYNYDTYREYCLQKSWYIKGSDIHIETEHYYYQDIDVDTFLMDSDGDIYDFTSGNIYKNGKMVYYNPGNDYNKNSSNSNKCYHCNGTGMVKYYYGGSSTEAALNGHEDSWYGQCGSCGGTGIAK